MGDQSFQQGWGALLGSQEVNRSSCTSPFYYTLSPHSSQRLVPSPNDSGSQPLACPEASSGSARESIINSPSLLLPAPPSLCFQNTKKEILSLVGESKRPLEVESSLRKATGDICPVSLALDRYLGHLSLEPFTYPVASW